MLITWELGWVLGSQQQEPHTLGRWLAQTPGHRVTRITLVTPMQGHTEPLSWEIKQNSVYYHVCVVAVSPGLGLGVCWDLGSPEQAGGGGNGNALQYPCLENPMDRGTWRATVNEVTKGQM